MNNCCSSNTIEVICYDESSFPTSKAEASLPTSATHTKNNSHYAITNQYDICSSVITKHTINTIKSLNYEHNLHKSRNQHT